MNITQEVLKQLKKIPHKPGLSYLLEGEDRLIEHIKSIAIVGAFADKLNFKYENYLKKNNKNFKSFKEIDATLKKEWRTFDCILIGSITRYAHYKKALLEIGVPRTLIAQPEEICQLSANFYSPDNSLPSWPNNEQSFEEKINWLTVNESMLSQAYYLIEPCSRQIFIDKITTYLRPNCINIFKDFIRNHSSPYKTLGSVPLNGDRPSYGVENFFYFYNDVINIYDNCVYVDIGAHVGDSLDAFLKRCSVLGLNYKHIFCFEPDKLSFDELLKNSKGLSNITLSMSAVLEEISMTGYNPVGTGGGSIIQNATVEIDQLIQAGPLSKSIADSRVDLIKWDTPGPGIAMKVFAGCESTIASHNPDLIIGAYHNVNDIFQIPIRLKEISNDYKIYLRHNSWLYTETCYYCIFGGTNK